jgi:membrane-associated phospholipid phosphatase
MILLDTQLNIALQNLGAWLTSPMDLFSFLGTGNFFFVLIPAILWCFDSGLGIRLGLAFFATSAINTLLKLCFHMPRPYWIDQNVKALSAESSFGFPSGHSQQSASVWGMVGFYRKNRLVMLSALLIVFMVGVSRVYLGMHFAADVVAGWLFGFLILIAFFLLDRPVSLWVEKTDPGIVLLCATFIIILLLGIGLVLQSGLQSWQLPDMWKQLGARGGSPINPISLKNLFSNCGLCLGFIAGACWLRSQERTLGKYSTTGTPRQKFLRFIVGISGLLLIWVVLGWIFPHEETFIGLALSLLRYALVGVWISGLAPYIFFRAKLVNNG